MLNVRRIPVSGNGILNLERTFDPLQSLVIKVGFSKPLSLLANRKNFRGLLTPFILVLGLSKFSL